MKNYNHVLMKRWLCDFVECFNRNHYYWQFQNENNRHYKLWFDHINRWNRAISQHDVTIKNSFNDLKKRLYVYVYAHQKKKTIEKTNQIANKIANASNATAFVTIAFDAITSNFISKFILLIEQKISLFQQFKKFIKTPIFQQNSPVHRQSYEMISLYHQFQSLYSPYTFYYMFSFSSFFFSYMISFLTFYLLLSFSSLFSSFFQKIVSSFF